MDGGGAAKLWEFSENAYSFSDARAFMLPLAFLLMKTQTEKPFDRKRAFFNPAPDPSNLNFSDPKRQSGEAKKDVELC